MTSARLFIRNDDVWTLDRAFCFFFESAMERGIPVIHAVIPGKMDKGLIRFLCRAKKERPHLLDIVQHGWVHANHSTDDTLKYEFGPSRDHETQQLDIRQGLKKMHQAFGEYFTSAFVPPYHGYDERTLQVLHEEGFEIFSAGTHRVEKAKRLINVPVQVSFTRYEEGKKGIREAKEMLALLARGVNRRALSGVVTHHADFKTAGNRRELTRFFDFIAAMGNKKEWKSLLFSDLGRK